MADESKNTIIRDPKNSDITIIRTPQGDIAFNFGVTKSGMEVENHQIEKLYPFTEAGRKETEHLLNHVLNPAKDSPKALQDLQSKFNETLVSAAKAYGKPLDVGTSPLLVGELGGGAMTHQKGQDQSVVLGLNLQEIVKAKFLGQDNKMYNMTPSEILRHELFHFVDVNVNEPTLKETRAVWFVNQFQEAEGRPKRTTYFNPDSAYYPGIVPVTGFSDGRILGVKIPGQREYPEPSPDYNRWSELQKEQVQKGAVSDALQNQTQSSSLVQHLATLPSHQQQLVAERMAYQLQQQESAQLG